MYWKPKLCELKFAIRTGRQSPGSYALNPWGPPPNYTNGTWEVWARGMSKAYLRGAMGKRRE